MVVKGIVKETFRMILKTSALHFKLSPIRIKFIRLHFFFLKRIFLFIFIVVGSKEGKYWKVNNMVLMTYLGSCCDPCKEHFINRLGGGVGVNCGVLCQILMRNDGYFFHWTYNLTPSSDAEQGCLHQIKTSKRKKKKICNE